MGVNAEITQYGRDDFLQRSMGFWALYLAVSGGQSQTPVSELERSIYIATAASGPEVWEYSSVKRKKVRLASFLRS